MSLVHGRKRAVRWRLRGEPRLLIRTHFGSGLLSELLGHVAPEMSRSREALQIVLLLIRILMRVC